MYTTGITIAVLCIAQIAPNFGASVGTEFCSKPTVADNLDTEWIQKNYKREWHLTTGNKDGRRHLAQILQGRTLGQDADYSNMCPTMALNLTDGNIGGQYHGFGGKSSDWSCRFDAESKIVCEYFTNPNKAYSEKASAYLSYFDTKESHNVYVAVICFDNGDVGWFAASATKSLSDEETNTVTEHVKSLGFEPESRVSMYNDKC